MPELDPVPNQDKLQMLKELCDKWVREGSLTPEQALDFYTEVAVLLTGEDTN